MAASQAYAYDLVRASRATSGMALTNLGGQLASTAGGLVGGYTLERLGSGATFGITAFAVLLAVIALVQLRTKPSGRPMPAAAPEPSEGATVATARGDDGSTPAESTDGPARPAARPARPPVDLGRAMTLLLRNRLLAMLSIAIVLAEIFGFASQTLLPTFAKDVFDVGASGLGMMMAVRSAGGSLGLLALSRIGAEGRSGLGFVVGAGLFGLALLLFANSPFYALALVLLGISGMCASVMDTLGQTLLQRNADERERGSAMGIWVFSVGFGPVGHLTLGAAATSFGAPQTQAVSGIMLMLVAALMSLHGPLRRAR
jgi:predicted MFS family arabinose efflux permease